MSNVNVDKSHDTFDFDTGIEDFLSYPWQWNIQTCDAPDMTIFIRVSLPCKHP